MSEKLSSEPDLTVVEHELQPDNGSETTRIGVSAAPEKYTDENGWLDTAQLKQMSQDGGERRTPTSLALEQFHRGFINPAQQHNNHPVTAEAIPKPPDHMKQAAKPKAAVNQGSEAIANKAEVDFEQEGYLVKYKHDYKGRVEVGLEFSQDRNNGLKLDWSMYPNTADADSRSILLYASDGEVYCFEENDMYNLSALERLQKGAPREGDVQSAKTLEEGEQPPAVTLGESLDLDGHKTASIIAAAVSLGDATNPDMADKDLTQAAWRPNYFDAACDMIDGYFGAETEVQEEFTANNAQEQTESTAEGRIFVNSTKVQYQPNEQGEAQRAYEFRTLTDAMDWDLYFRLNGGREGSEIVLTTSKNETICIKEGKTIYDLANSKLYQLEEGEGLPLTVIGKGLSLGDTITDPIWSVAIKGSKVSEAETATGSEGWIQGGSDPFTCTEYQLKQLQAAANSPSGEVTTAAAASNEAVTADPSAEETEAPIVPVDEAGRLPITDLREMGLREAEPLQDVSKQGIRNRLKHIMGRAAEYRNGLYAYAGVKAGNAIGSLANGLRSAKSSRREYYSDEEKGSLRRKVTGVVIGAVAVAGVAGIAYLEIKGHGGINHAANHRELLGGNNTDLQETLTKSLHEVNKTVTEFASTAVPTAAKAAHKTHEHVAPHLHQVSLPKGDTVWHIASEQLQQHGNVRPTDAQIWEHTNHILHMNHLNWEQARQLADDTKLKV